MSAPPRSEPPSGRAAGPSGGRQTYRRKRYKGGEGMWSWILHRGSGLMVLGFLFLHILDTSLVSFGKHHYDSFVGIYKTAWFRPLEVLLVGAVIYHSMNGLRVVLIDFWEQGVRHERRLAVAVNVVTLVLFVPAAVIMLRPIF